MTDFVGNTYLVDLAYVLTVIWIMIIHYYHASLRINRRRHILILAECVHIICLLYWFNERHSGFENMWNTGNVVSYSLAFIVLEPVIMCIFILVDYIGKESVDELNNDSISEAILNLPTGLCFSEIDGQIVLENMKMEDIWYGFAGKTMTDANEAWEYLENSIDEDNFFQLDDKTVWNFERKQISISDHVYIRTKADDVTELNHLYYQLKETNESLDSQNRKTRQLLLNIAKINEEEERLDIQRKIHHEIGQCIIAANHFLSEEEDENIWKALLSMWERVFGGNAEIEEKENMEDKENEIIEAARIGGCDVHFSGCRPQDDRKYSLYLAAVREAVTNAIWHGQADNVYVDGSIVNENGEKETQKKGEHLVVSIKNDGKNPTEPIDEGVGLGKLREKLIRAGIKMEIFWQDEIEMRLYF